MRSYEKECAGHTNEKTRGKSMSKKQKSKRIPRLTEAEYSAYLSALKDETPVFHETAQSQAIENEENYRNGK